MNIPELTATAKTTMPDATNGRGESRPQNPTSNNEDAGNQSSGTGRSQHGIAGAVIITTITLAILALI